MDVRCHQTDELGTNNIHIVCSKQPIGVGATSHLLIHTFFFFLLAFLALFFSFLSLFLATHTHAEKPKMNEFPSLRPGRTHRQNACCVSESLPVRPPRFMTALFFFSVSAPDCRWPRAFVSPTLHFHTAGAKLRDATRAGGTHFYRQTRGSTVSRPPGSQPCRASSTRRSCFRTRSPRRCRFSGARRSSKKRTCWGRTRLLPPPVGKKHRRKQQ